MERPTVSVIGAGKLGSTMALALAERGYTVSGLSDNDPARLKEVAQAVKPGLFGPDPAVIAREAEIVLLTVPDDSIRQVSDFLASRQAVAKGQILCHCSGFLPSSILVANKMLGASIASMHPLASFPQLLAAWDQYRGVYFGLEGDAAAMGRLRTLIDSLAGHPVDVQLSRKALYHASSVMASNCLAALLYAAGQIMEAAVEDREEAAGMLKALSGTVLDNIRRNGPEGALSGPIERGDVRTVAGHLEALAKDFPGRTELYKTLGKISLEIAKQQHPERGDWDAIGRLLD